VAFEAAARDVGFLGFGFYPRSGFMHIDFGPARQWGERFPVRSAPMREQAWGWLQMIAGHEERPVKR
jgi:hypothetical protein